MPEFIPQHIPSAADQAPFLKGYMAAAEWLLDERIDRTKIRGWSADAVRVMREDCNVFQRLHVVPLHHYVELRRAETEARGYDPLECAGQDFFLTRNGHGVGFKDRGEAEWFAKLDQGARFFSRSEVDPWLDRGRLRID
jgi:hypothetical protein